jgi:hypothetical protein
MAGPPGTLPPQFLSLLSSLKSTLKGSFADAPPHTAQRFAELILRPTRHYRTLPSYLRALDRVLSVSSPANVFPLPPLVFSMDSVNGRLLNGSSTPDASNAPGSDDFIGGAELTPIPWLNVSTMSSYLSGAERAYTSDLRTESTSLIDGPNGAGSLETVTVSINGILSSSSSSNNGRNRDDLPSRTERGSTTSLSTPNPLHENPHSHQNGNPRPLPSTGETNSTGEISEEIEERVIARGPDMIGMEDIGPQAPEAQNFVVHPERQGDEIETPEATRKRSEGEGNAEEEGVTSPPHLQENKTQRTLSSKSTKDQNGDDDAATHDDDDVDDEEEEEEEEGEGNEEAEEGDAMQDSTTTMGMT